MPSPTIDSPVAEERESLLPTTSSDTPMTKRRKDSSRSSAWSIISRHVRFSESSGDTDSETDGADDEEYVVHERKRTSRMKGLVQVLTYLVLVSLGLAVGILVGRAIWRRTETKGHGPMVPPVFELPPPTGLPRNPAYLIEAKHGAVASEDVTCSNLGVSIMRDRNGTAVDAAVTTTLCIGLLNAFSSGIGGGGFMVIRIPENASVPGHSQRQAGILSIDFRETSPRNSDKWMYGSKKAGRTAAQVGGLAIGVPGELRGLESAHQMYGNLPWKDVVMPVAELAKGWHVSRELARRLRVFGQFMLDAPEWTEVYAPLGYLAVEGDWIKRENYGRTLEKIANEGAQAFYNGEIADSIVKTVKGNGGIIDHQDLRDYGVRISPAIHQTYHGKSIYTTYAPSSGPVLLGMLNLLEPYNLHEHGCLDTDLNTHRMLEAMKFAFGARSEITDPLFTKNTLRFDEFYSKKWADEIRPKITDNATHDFNYYGLQHDTPIDHGTTHLSVVDRWGGAASVTSTVNLIWGSHVMDPRTGVIFNDEQDDFAVPGAPDAFGLQPSPWNYPKPGKKPLSSTSASIILNEDGSLYAILGGSGGSRIFPSIAQVILNLECGLNLSAAIERPRVHNQIVPPVTTVEVGPEGEDKEMLDGLRERGQKIGVFDINLGIAEVQGILLENGTIWASSDSRKNGIAAGY